MKKIAVVTTTRADYGLLRGLIQRLHENSDLELQLYVSGTHLLAEFGETIKEIQKEGYPIIWQEEILDLAKKPESMALSVAKACEKLSLAFVKNQPDLVVVLGDRFEIMGVTQAAFLMHIPVAHIHGGEVTEGAIDDSIRHAITKMSHLHFAAAQEYADRIVQMGEVSARVFCVGAPGLDASRDAEIVSREELESSLGIKLSEKLYLVTYHPETLADSLMEGESIEPMLEVLGRESDATVLFTMPNIDAGSEAIAERIKKICQEKANFYFFESLGATRYFSLIKQATAVVGNSSSGIIEAPYFKTPTINIGGRQDGRLRAPSVIDCEMDEESLLEAFQKASEQDFLEKIKSQKSCYGDGNASEKIADVITNLARGTGFKGLLRKEFYDMRKVQ